MMVSSPDQAANELSVFDSDDGSITSEFPQDILREWVQMTVQILLWSLIGIALIQHEKCYIYEPCPVMHTRIPTNIACWYYSV